MSFVLSIVNICISTLNLILLSRLSFKSFSGSGLAANISGSSSSGGSSSSSMQKTYTSSSSSSSTSHPTKSVSSRKVYSSTSHPFYSPELSSQRYNAEGQITGVNFEGLDDKMNILVALKKLIASIENTNEEEKNTSKKSNKAKNGSNLTSTINTGFIKANPETTGKTPEIDINSEVPKTGNEDAKVKNEGAKTPEAEIITKEATNKIAKPEIKNKEVAKKPEIDVPEKSLVKPETPKNVSEMPSNLAGAPGNVPVKFNPQNIDANTAQQIKETYQSYTSGSQKMVIPQSSISNEKAKHSSSLLSKKPKGKKK